MTQGIHTMLPPTRVSTAMASPCSQDCDGALEPDPRVIRSSLVEAPPVDLRAVRYGANWVVATQGPLNLSLRSRDQETISEPCHESLPHDR